MTSQQQPSLTFEQRVRDMLGVQFEQERRAYAASISTIRSEAVRSGFSKSSSEILTIVQAAERSIEARGTLIMNACYAAAPAVPPPPLARLEIFAFDLLADQREDVEQELVKCGYPREAFEEQARQCCDQSSAALKARLSLLYRCELTLATYLRAVWSEWVVWTTGSSFAAIGAVLEHLLPKPGAPWDKILDGMNWVAFAAGFAIAQYMACKKLVDPPTSPG